MSLAPGVTSVEVYGFVGWVTSAAALVLYLLWAYVPDRVLWAHGVTYYPNKYWAVAFPTWVCVTVVAVYWMYESLNKMSARSRGQPSQTKFALIGSGMPPNPSMCQYFSTGDSSSILPLRIIPPEVVDMVLKEGKVPQEAERLYKARMNRRTADQQGLSTRTAS